MKTLRNLTAAAFIFVLALSASAFAGHQTAQGACDSNRRIHSIHKSLVADGYTLESVDDQQVAYFVIPKAPFNWGNIIYTYSRPLEGHFGMLERVQLTIQVQALTDGFSFPEITIHEASSN